jgi:BolA protein
LSADYGIARSQEQGMTLGPVGETLSRKLKQSFSPQRLEVVDESHLHAGHSGSHPQGESHFRVDIMAEAFSGKSRVERHRMVNEALAAELKSRVHALAIRAKAPEDGLIFAAIAAEDGRLVALLRHNDLPTDDLAGATKRYFGFMTAAGDLAAAGGLETCDGHALLRSISVADDWRGKGLGRAMVRKLLAEARRGGADVAYLLTHSAKGFFAKMGFTEIDRGEVPAAIALTSQFSGARCSSAEAMVLKLMAP